MYFEQFYLTCLSHASYMLGSDGVAAVVDPQRDVELYLRAAEENNLDIKYVIETHLHADFVSGHQELAARTGASIYLGAKAGAKFAHVPVQDGDQLAFGGCRLDFLETPGHTIEGVSVVVTDLAKSPEPFAVLTGDTLFIGDVGRPDLGGELTPRQLAGMLYDSLHGKLLKLPDSVQVFPAHGAGSLCGRQMSSERSSTIGKEKAANYALLPSSREAFVEMLTAELPERPSYFALDVEINRSGAPSMAELKPIAALQPSEFAARQRQGAIALDTRPAGDFGAAHVPGSLQIGLAGQYASWAGILLGLDSELLLIAEDLERVNESRTRLARVGIERVSGYLDNGIAGWIEAGLPVEQTPQITVQQLHETLADRDSGPRVIDVRRPAEWEAGHVEQATLMPLNTLSGLLHVLNPAEPLAVYCKGGYRSAIAASILQRAGFQHVMNVIGGYDAWHASQLPSAAGGKV
ncbi:MAG: MBL fold metallo-hydrolase [Bryobacteraceae bacterium]